MSEAGKERDAEGSTEGARRSLRLLIGANLVLLLVNLLALALIVLGGDDPLQPPVAQGPDGPPSAAAPASTDPVEGFLLATIEPLSRAAREHNDDPAAVLPSEAALEAAIASGSLDSPASTDVIARLKEGYARYRMPFPSLPAAPATPPGAPPPEPEGASSGSATDILNAYFIVALQRVEREAERQGMDPASLLPEATLVEAAVSSGSIESEASARVLDALRAAHASLGLPFQEPVVPTQLQ